MGRAHRFPSNSRHTRIVDTPLHSTRFFLSTTPLFEHHHSLPLSLHPSAFFSSFTMASASLEDRFEQITIHDDNNENGATSYHKSKVSAQTVIA
jgi:hypothetical protein